MTLTSQKDYKNGKRPMVPWHERRRITERIRPFVVTRNARRLLKDLRAPAFAL
jgi:hypothetical protein